MALMDHLTTIQLRAPYLILIVAPIGGVVPDSWWEAFEAGARAGLDIV